MPIANLEETLINWSKRSSDTEEQKCENALAMIKDAIYSYDKFKSMEIQFIPQGSYHNNTNVRQNSDVDICVKLCNPFFAQYPEGMSKEDFGNTDGKYSFAEYIADVERALAKKFGPDNFQRGNKAFDLHSNSYRVDADVVACLEHRRYRKDGTFIKGTQFYAKDGSKIINFPEQHYINGVAKNDATGRRYKRVVRILKRLKMKMVGDGIQGLDNISSFLIECLVWNVDNSCFNQKAYTNDVQDVLAYLYHNTKEQSLCNDWGEVSDLFYLLRSGRKYTREEVNAFILKAYNYLFS